MIWAFRGKRNHYEDGCYHKQLLSATLKTEAQSGGGSAGGKSQGEKGKGNSEGRGEGQGPAEGKGGERRGPNRKNQDTNKDKNQDRSGGSPNTTPRETNPELSGGQQNTGPMTRLEPQAQQEQGTMRANEDGDEFNVRKRSCLMRMARKLRKKGFDVTCHAVF